MFQIFAEITNIFGYIMKFLYDICQNYGIAIIIFTVIIKLLQLPLSIKQQKAMEKNAEMQEEIKKIQFKYKNDQEKMNNEILELYKKEKISPFSGCFMSIIQIVLILSIFYLVKSPLTYMEKVSDEKLNNYKNQLIQENKLTNEVYQEIDLMNEYEFLKQKNPEDKEIEKLNLNMDFFGLDLKKVPQQHLNDYKVYIIPVLYIISSFAMIKITNKMQEKMIGTNKKEIDGTTGKEVEAQEENPMLQANKMMSWMMPIMSISIAMVAPLGLALYWLVSNILMILERIILDKYIKA